MEESPLFTKTYDLLQWLLPATLKFPREQRFVLAKRIQEAAFDFQDAILAAGLGQERSRNLQAADVHLKRLQVYIRLSRDLKFIDMGQYEHVSRMTVEMGRLLGGWCKKAGV